MRALFYAPGGGAAGFGHTMRALGLAEKALSRGWQVALAGQVEGAALAEARLVEGLTILGGDRATLLDHAADFDVVHLDTYDERLPDLRTANLLLSSMADTDFGLRSADLIIDTSPTAPGRAQIIRDRSGGEVLAGVEFVPLRSRARRLAGLWSGSGAERPQVLVVMGGTDPLGLTAPVVEKLAMVAGIDVTVVAAVERHAELQAIWAGRLETLTCRTFLSDLPETARHHDLVVSASGTSVWEFACVGTPMALVCAVDNQVDNYRALVAHGAAIGMAPEPGSLGDVTAIVAGTVYSPEALQRLSEAARELVDGRGACRVVRCWETLVRDEPARPHGTSLIVRAAGRADSEMLRDWRNDEITRCFSRQPDPVDRTAHERWFESVLADRGRHLLVAEMNGRAVGTVRWDEEAPAPWEGRWEVSVTIAPEQRGRGLAVPMLVVAEEWLTQAVSGPQRLLALIHATNHASARIFARAGYLPDLDADETGFFRLSRSVVGRSS